MKACTRPEAPDLIKRYGEEIGAEYASRKQADRKYRFQWPLREGQNLGRLIHDTLKESMNEGHCAYCDGWPIDETSREEVDHFQPKGRPEFYRLVCNWNNLFLSCSACNNNKLEQWDEDLLRPDADDYDFMRYFEYETATGKLKPNPAASADDRKRAEVTIRILGLCRDGACTGRRNALRNYQAARRNPDDDRRIDDFPHRYLFSLLE